MPGNKALRFIPFVLLGLVVSACAGRPSGDGPARGGSSVPSSAPADAIPRDEPRSRYGNPPVYEVYGVRYEVMRSSYGYQERGVASWYGKKFHGRATSSQEPYDMYAMTAAHKTLPLPTYVEVRNLRNNRTVIVRVNDRGPFVDNRIIDLSYSAAQKLDLIRDGTGLVEVTAISFDEMPPETRTMHADAAPAPTQTPTQTQTSVAVTAAPAATPEHEAQIFVQVGAFGDPANAQRRIKQLRENGVSMTFVLEDHSRSPALYRVRIGPITNVDQYDALIAHLRGMGIADSHLVTE